MKLSGSALAKELLADIKIQSEKLIEKGTTPHFVVFLIGDNPESHSYVDQKIKRARDVGIICTVEYLPEKITEAELIKKITLVQDDPFVHGIIIQRPLPAWIAKEAVDQAVSPQKDIDGFRKDSAFAPPVALAVEELLKEVHKQKQDSQSFNDWLQSKQIVILGKGETAGAPVIKYFQYKNLNPRIIDSKTQNSHELTHSADIIISAVGRPDTIRKEHIKKGSILISIGMSKMDDQFVGDYEENDIENTAGFYTPTPGGTGPVNVAMLLQNVLQAAAQQTSHITH